MNIAHCNHCGATGPWIGRISSLNPKERSGEITPTNCGTCHGSYSVSFRRERNQ